MPKVVRLISGGILCLIVSAAAILVPDPVHAEGCRNTQSFKAWRSKFVDEALLEGVSRGTVRRTRGQLRYVKKIIRRDRGQSFFRQSFRSFYNKLATKNRVVRGRRLMKKYKKFFDRAEKRYGVPREVITAFWGLESDYGTSFGKLPVIPSLATLAYDCRRGDQFREDLMAALKIVDRGDLTPKEMIGSWAGELGQTQFLPRHYLKHAIDFNRDGKVDLFASPADIIGSSAKYIAHLGWRSGEPWLQEVRVPKKMPWGESDLVTQHPRAKWAEWGVRQRNRDPLIRDSLPASLLLPMGRRGPAFLAYENFRVYTRWNQSLSYGITAAHLATRLGGAPNMRQGPKSIPFLKYNDTKRLQQRLRRRGYDVGKIDGRVGAKTRAAVRDVQRKFGLPADGYPRPKLLKLLK